MFCEHKSKHISCQVLTDLQYITYLRHQFDTEPSHTKPYGICRQVSTFRA